MVIQTENLTKHYFLGITRKRVEGLNDLNLEVRQGEILAFLGLNGAGKTTTIKLLLDHVKPTAGRASIFGRDSRDSRTRNRVGYLPDTPNFYRFLTGAEMLDYCGRLFNLKAAERRKRATALLELTGIADRADEPLLGYSRGMLQRLALAQALINDPELVILDEPLGGLDPLGRIDLRDIILDLKKQGRTVFFSSHILQDAQHIADRVGIIHRSRLLVSGTLDELTKAKSGWEVVAVPLEAFDAAGFCREKDWEMTGSDGSIRIIIGVEAELIEVHRLAAEGRIRVESIRRRMQSLEEAFQHTLEQWNA